MNISESIDCSYLVETLNCIKIDKLNNEIGSENVSFDRQIHPVP